MGITGLLPFLKNASRPTHVSEFKGLTIAIDVYCWLHKGAFGCAEKLVKGQKTDGYIVYVMKYVDLLLFHGIKPVLVFDGRNLPSKSETEKKRRENRAKYKKMAKDHLAAGQYREARDCFQRCIDITPEMAREVIAACRERNIDCIVAPYEADAQLAFLCQAKIVDMVISEDSDLTLFGCEKILFKLDANGNGVLVEMSKLNACLGNKADNFNLEKFRYMCIMSGCDYLSSLHGIGLGKSLKFWSKVTNLDLRKVLPKIPSYLNMHQLTVTEEYIEGFIQANLTFLHQLVFDPKEKILRPLNEYPEYTTAKKLPFCGEMVSEDLALGLALGNYDLHSLQKVNDYNPDSPNPMVEKPRYGRRAQHASIWGNASIDVPNPVEEQRKADNETIMKCFSATPKEEKTTVKPSFTSAQKRKREPSPALVCTPETIEDILDAPADEEDVIFKSRFFSKKTSKSPKKLSGDWLETLDDCSPATDRVKYTPDVSDQVLRKPFKPVSLQKPLNSDDFAKKRNPFAVHKTPEKKAKLDFEPLEVKLDQVKKCSESPPLDLEVSVVHKTPEKKADSLRFDESTTPKKESSSVKSPEIKSHYFQPTRKPRISGLLKPGKAGKKVDKKQPSLMDLWSKKTQK